MNRRKIIDMNELIKKKKIDIIDNNVNKFNYIIKGPKDTLYENYEWKILIEIPDKYPFKSPSVGFVDKIYHPNVDFKSGSICLDAINEQWTPAYNLLTIIDILLPQLLTYPNPDDPLNHEAADLLINNEDKYNETVEIHNKKYAISIDDELKNDENILDSSIIDF